MKKSESIAKLAKSLATFQVKVDKIHKDAKNPFFKSSYASLSNIIEATATPLAESGLVISQHPTGDNELTTILMHAESGEYIESCYNIHPVKSDPQATGSAITYARRYALVSILCLNVDDDDDANKATHGTSTPQQAPAQPVNGKEEKPWLNKWADKNQTKETAEWGKVLSALTAGKAVAADVEKKYKVSKELKEELKSFEKKA